MIKAESIFLGLEVKNRFWSSLPIGLEGTHTEPVFHSVTNEMSPAPIFFDFSSTYKNPVKRLRWLVDQLSPGHPRFLSGIISFCARIAHTSNSPAWVILPRPISKDWISELKRMVVWFHSFPLGSRVEMKIRTNYWRCLFAELMCSRLDKWCIDHSEYSFVTNERKMDCFYFVFGQCFCG